MTKNIIISIKRFYNAISILNQLYCLKSDTLSTCLGSDKKSQVTKLNVNFSNWA